MSARRGTRGSKHKLPIGNLCVVWMELWFPPAHEEFVVLPRNIASPPVTDDLVLVRLQRVVVKTQENPNLNHHEGGSWGPRLLLCHGEGLHVCRLSRDDISRSLCLSGA